MTMYTTTRRAFLASVPIAVPAGAATALSGLLASPPGSSDTDAELHMLWGRLVVQREAELAVFKKIKLPRRAYDAELPQCPDDVRLGDHYRAHEWLWRKHGLDKLTEFGRA